MMPNLLKRFLSAAVLLPLVIAVVLLGPSWSIAALVVLFSFFCGMEFSSICFPGRGASFRATFSAICALASAAVSLFTVFPAAPLFALLVLPPLSFFLFLFSSPDKTTSSDSLRSVAFSALGIAYSGALLGTISLFFPISSLSWESSSSASPEGRYWILLLLFGIIASDTFAYAFGRLFGVRKLAPHISPGKTWAGAFGSVFGTVLSVCLFSFFFLPAFHPLAAAALGLLLSLFGQLGDLCESLLKRAFSVKDSGRLIPGHGGVLDRLDSLMFGAPVVLSFFWLR